MENAPADDLLYPGDYDYRPDDDHYRPESEDIAVAVLLLLGILAILPALGWIIWSFYRKRWDKKQVSFFFVSLLLADTLQLITSPFIVETVITGVPCWHASWWCITVYVLFSVTRFNGLFFHLLVALEKIVSQSSLCEILCVGLILKMGVWPIYIIFAILAHVIDMNYLFFYGCNTFFGIVAVIIAAAACVKGLKPFATLNPTKEKCQSLKVLAVAMCTFVILYVPEFLYWLIYHHKPALTEGFSYVVHYLPCLRPITDSVLCWFVCMVRERPSEQQLTVVQLNSPILHSSCSVTSPS